ncbi:hypothetical protein LAU_0128 [Lausannevirus]|uniref:Uncharacterized protein n=1 Tax=Lausannevirus TaxID=999883 RepID=F2WL56_9VIRU|nr:hypothetical protein LAU_0128 [Lausannevirus]AEA06979.1 hypothetical protein LAU_0128 [Lausannevirus]
MKRFLLAKELVCFSLLGAETPLPEEHLEEDVSYMWSSSHQKIIKKSFWKLPNGMLHGKSTVTDQSEKIFEIKEWSFGKVVNKNGLTRATYG